MATHADVGERNPGPGTDQRAFSGRRVRSYIDRAMDETHELVDFLD